MRCLELFAKSEAKNLIDKTTKGEWRDALGRLPAFRDGAANTAIESYSYDATGNRTSFANAAGTQPYAYPADSHRLAAVAGQARTYDAVGNTLTDGSGRSYVVAPA